MEQKNCAGRVRYGEEARVEWGTCFCLVSLLVGCLPVFGYLFMIRVFVYLFMIPVPVFVSLLGWLEGLVYSVR